MLITSATTSLSSIASTSVTACGLRCAGYGRAHRPLASCCGPGTRIRAGLLSNNALHKTDVVIRATATRV